MHCDLQRWGGKNLQPLEHVQLTSLMSGCFWSSLVSIFLLVLICFFIVLFLINNSFVMSLSSLSFLSFQFLSLHYVVLSLLCSTRSTIFSLLLFSDPLVYVLCVPQCFCFSRRISKILVSRFLLMVRKVCSLAILFLLLIIFF